MAVSSRLDLLTANYSIGLLAGTTPLHVLTGSHATITPGTLATETLDCHGDTAATGDLSIDLGSSWNQVDFDNVMLTAVPISQVLKPAVAPPMPVVDQTNRNNQEDYREC